MKQNSCPVVGEVAKPTCIGLDELDCAIETFSAGIADFVLTEVEQARLMVPEHLDYLFDWLQTTPHRVGGPCVKESLSRTFVTVAPELGEVLFAAPGPTGLEIELVQSPKGHRLSTAPIRIVLEPRPFAARQWRCARLGQPAVFLFSHSVHCLTEVFEDVKLVMHDVGLGHALLGRTHKGRPHIHGHRFDRCALRWRERFKQADGRIELSLRHQIEYPRAVNIGQDSCGPSRNFSHLFPDRQSLVRCDAACPALRH